jgi:hypothetical protein
MALKTVKKLQPKDVYKKSLATIPAILALSACGGGGGTGGGSGGGVRNPGYNTPPPNDPDDDGVDTVVVLDYYSGPSGYHGDFVENTLDKVTDARTVGVDRANSPLASQTDDLLVQVNSAHEPEVINMSTAQTYVTTSTHPVPTALTHVIRDLYEEGTAVVASAGNEGSFGASFSRNQSELDITVGATDASGKITSYSNYHPEMVDFYAPGDSAPTLYSTGGSSYILVLQGTSFSSPKVAGMVVEIMQDNPDYTMSEIRTLLELNSEYLVHDDGQGHVFTYQYLDGLDTTDHVIDTRVIVEAGFELFEDMNPTQALLDQWVSQIDSGQKDYVDLKQFFDDTTFDGYTLGVAAVEKAQAFYHWNYHRESTDQEVLKILDGIAPTDPATEATSDLFIGVEEIGIIATPEDILHSNSF